MRKEDVYVGPLAKIVKIETRPDEKHHTIFTRYIEPVGKNDTILYKRHDDYFVDVCNNDGYRSVYYAREGEICVYEDYLVNISEYFNDVEFTDEVSKSQTKQLAKSMKK